MLPDTSPGALAAVGLRVTQDGPVVTLMLDRPEVRNAQTPAMWQAMARVGAALTDDVRVVVVRGAGAGFSAGLDRRLLDPAASGEDGSVAAQLSQPDDVVHETIDGYQQGFTWLRDPRFVSIAAVHGHAIGAGFQLALSCDLRLATTDATFSMREAALGLVPDLTGTQPLVQQVGYARALEICVSARAIPADEALALGIVLDVVAPEALDSRLTALVASLTASLPGVGRETKALLLGSESRTLDEQRLLERQAQARRFRELAAMLG